MGNSLSVKGANCNSSKLFTYFNFNQKCYEIECISLSKKSICLFSNNELGKVQLDRKKEVIIDYSKTLEMDYEIFIRRMIKVWKKHFNNI